MCKQLDPLHEEYLNEYLENPSRGFLVRLAILARDSGNLSERLERRLQNQISTILDKNFRDRWEDRSCYIMSIYDIAFRASRPAASRLAHL